jgi:hypothetical protein
MTKYANQEKFNMTDHINISKPEPLKAKNQKNMTVNPIAKGSWNE